MKWIIAITACIAMIGIILGLLLKKKNKAKLTAIRPLSTPEQILYFRLAEALPDHIVLAQVAFSRFLKASGGSKKENWSKFGTIRQKVADYVICKKDFSIEAVIELDDSSHNKFNDEKRDETLKQAGINSIRWNVKNLPNAQQIAVAVGYKEKENERNK
jgi:hypothetical protein